MITREEIKKVEKLQKLQNEKWQLEKDYKEIIENDCFSDVYGILIYKYKKYLKIVINNKIRIIDKKIKELVK